MERGHDLLDRRNFLGEGDSSNRLNLGVLLNGNTYDVGVVGSALMRGLPFMPMPEEPEDSY